jgi:hypothetical protein
VIRCSICQREFKPEESPAMPFCSERCRLIDLGRWLDERNRMPVEPAEDATSEPSDEGHDV